MREAHPRTHPGKGIALGDPAGLTGIDGGTQRHELGLVSLLEGVHPGGDEGFDTRETSGGNLCLGEAGGFLRQIGGREVARRGRVLHDEGNSIPQRDPSRKRLRGAGTVGARRYHTDPGAAAPRAGPKRSDPTHRAARLLPWQAPPVAENPDPPLRLSDLPPETIAQLKTYRYDRIIEKHEGPEDWSWRLRDERPSWAPEPVPGVEDDYTPDPSEFLRIAGRDVLLPVGRSHHPNITVLRAIVSDDDKSLTLFLKDTTYVESAKEEFFSAGFLAICDRVPGERFYLAHVYHEWFILDPIG